MNLVAQLFAALAGLIHILFFMLESVLFRRPSVHANFRVASGDVEAVRPWAYNQGWYNLFLAAGAIGGVVAVHAGAPAAGRTLVLFTAACMLAAALVLLSTNRAMLRGALIQGVPALVALIAAY